MLKLKNNEVKKLISKIDGFDNKTIRIMLFADYLV